MLSVKSYNQIAQAIASDKIVRIVFELLPNVESKLSEYFSLRSSLMNLETFNGIITSDIKNYQYDFHIIFISATTEVNIHIPVYCVDKFYIELSKEKVSIIFDKLRSHDEINNIMKLLYKIIHSTHQVYTIQERYSIIKWLIDCQLEITKFLSYSNAEFSNCSLAHSVSGDPCLLLFHDGIWTVSLDMKDVCLISRESVDMLDGTVLQGISVPKHLRNKGAPGSIVWFIPYDALQQTRFHSYSTDIKLLPHVLRLNYAYDVEIVANRVSQRLLTINCISFKWIDNIEEFLSRYRQLNRSKDLMSYKTDGILMYYDNKLIKFIRHIDKKQLMFQHHKEVLDSITSKYEDYLLVDNDSYWKDEKTFIDFLNIASKYPTVIYYGLDGDLVDLTFNPINGIPITVLKLGKHKLIYGKTLRIDDEEHYLVHINDILKHFPNANIEKYSLDSTKLPLKQRILSRMYSIAVITWT